MQPPRQMDGRSTTNTHINAFPFVYSLFAENILLCVCVVWILSYPPPSFTVMASFFRFCCILHIHTTHISFSFTLISASQSATVPRPLLFCVYMWLFECPFQLFVAVRLLSAYYNMVYCYCNCNRKWNCKMPEQKKSLSRACQGYFAVMHKANEKQEQRMHKMHVVVGNGYGSYIRCLCPIYGHARDIVGPKLSRLPPCQWIVSLWFVCVWPVVGNDRHYWRLTDQMVWQMPAMPYQRWVIKTLADNNGI